MKCNLSGPMIREVSVLSQSSPVQTRLTLQYLFFFFYQMVPRTLVGQGGREAADRERKERQLPGEREPESSGGFRPVGSHRRRQDGQQWQQTQSHSRHDPLPGKPSAHRLCVSSYLLSARDQSQTVLCDWPWQVDQSQMCPIPGNLISKSPDFWCMTPNFITTSRSPPEVTVLLYSSWFMTSLHTFMLCFFFLGMTVWNPVFGAVQRVVYCPAGNGEQKEILKQISMSLETKTYGSASNFPPSSRGIPVWARNFDLCSISQDDKRKHTSTKDQTLTRHLIVSIEWMLSVHSCFTPSPSSPPPSAGLFFFPQLFQLFHSYQGIVTRETMPLTLSIMPQSSLVAELKNIENQSKC